MDKQPVKQPSKTNTWIAVAVVVVVVVVVGSFIGLDYHNLFKSNTTSPSGPQTLYVYPGVSGSQNSNHLLGGCVVAIAHGGSAVTASEQLVAFLLNPAVQQQFEQSTGFIPVDQGAFSSSPSSSVPTLYASSMPSVTVTYYNSMSTADESFINSELATFHTMYPNINVQASYIGASSILSAIQAEQSSSSNNQNIVMTIDNLDVGTLFYEGYLANLTSSVSAMTSGAGVLSSIANLNNYEVNVFGGTYFLTQLVNIPLVWMDYTALQNAGISAAPTTYTQLFADAQTLYNKYGVGEINFQGHGGASTATELYQWMVQFGGNPMVFNDTGDIKAMEFLYNMSPYLSPEYTTSYWATYTGLASNTYTMMYYQWPGSVNLTKLSMKPYNNSDTALNESLAAINGGVFLRSPVVWINQWQLYIDTAFISIVVDHGTTSYSSIPGILAGAHAEMFNYLNDTTGPFYGPSIAQEYNNGVFQPVSV